jgi:DNA-binding transcriptional regulator YdaS (Cro superfamily)
MESRYVMLAVMADPNELPSDPLSDAIAAAGGVSKLASLIGVRQNAVSNWRTRGQVPAEHCLSIEQAVEGKVTRYELRPDVFGAPPDNEPRVAA